jgi:hypothetical protein
LLPYAKRPTFVEPRSPSMCLPPSQYRCRDCADFRIITDERPLRIGRHLIGSPCPGPTCLRATFDRPRFRVPPSRKIIPLSDEVNRPSSASCQGLNFTSIGGPSIRPPVRSQMLNAFNGTGCRCRFAMPTPMDHIAKKLRTYQEQTDIEHDLNMSKIWQRMPYS